MVSTVEPPRASLCLTTHALPIHSNQSKTVLVLSQVYLPDPASLGQHVAGAARELVRRGHRVIVYTSVRGYDDASIRYPSREVIDGVEVRRLPLSSFGKKKVAWRLLAALLFVFQCAARGLFVRNLGGVLFSTSPPMCSIAALCIRALRRVPILFWVMDIDPDQAVSLGWVSEKALSVRLFNWLNRTTLRRCDRVVTLDRFMAERLNNKVEMGDKLHVMPPWPHDQHLEPIDHENNPFRTEHGLSDKFVIMYSGNISPTTPVTALLAAALQLQDEKELLFMFIGGGTGMAEVKKTIDGHHPPNIKALPYQPLEKVKYSLSAADVHAVTMVDKLVSIAHPCKVYGAMAVERPILYLGPDDSHVGDLLKEGDIGWRVPIDDTDALVSTIGQILQSDRQTVRQMGKLAGEIIREQLSEDYLCGALTDVMEQAMQ